MRLWPDALPTPSMPGFGLSPVDPVLRTDMEAGAKRARRTTFARHDLVDMQWTFNDAEMAAFRAWWNDEPWSLAGESESLAGWTRTAASRDIGGAVSPEGLIVDRLMETATTSLHHAERALPDAGVSGELLCRATLKSAGRRNVKLALFDRAGVECWTNVDLVTGALGLQSGLSSRLIEDRGNGWWRVTVTAPVSTGAAVPATRISILSPDLVISYAGNSGQGIAVSEIGARMATGFDLHLRTDAAGKALGAAGGAGWALVPIAAGGGFKAVEARFNGPFKAQAGAGLNWSVTAQMEVRNA